MPQAAQDQSLISSALTLAQGTPADLLKKVISPKVNSGLWLRPPQESIIQEASTLQASKLPLVDRRDIIRSLIEAPRADERVTNPVIRDCYMAVPTMELNGSDVSGLLRACAAET